MTEQPRQETDFNRLVGGLIAAALLAYAGLQMTSLRSVSGESLAEVFYQAMGFLSFGLAALAASWATARR